MAKHSDISDTINGLNKVISAREKEFRTYKKSELKNFKMYSTLSNYLEKGSGRYLFVAEGDNCNDCQSLNGQIFNSSNAKIGVNCPPLHRNCDCFITILNDDGKPVATVGSKSVLEDQDTVEKQLKSALREALLSDENYFDVPMEVLSEEIPTDNIMQKVEILAKDGMENYVVLPDINTPPTKKEESYLKRSLNQIVQGNYTDDVTLAGTVGQLLLGFTGLDALADARDIIYDVTHWENSKEHITQTALDLVGLIPLIGVLKSADEVGTIAKNSDKIADIAKDVDKIVDATQNAVKHSDEVSEVVKDIVKYSDESVDVVENALKNSDNIAEDIIKNSDEAVLDAGKHSDDVAENIARHSTETIESGLNGKLIGSLDGLTSAEKNVVDKLIGNGSTVEIIPRSNINGIKTPDFLINGVKTELKTLTGTSMNTPVTRIQEAFKQGAEAVIIDGTDVGLTAEQAQIILNRASGIYQGHIPGNVQIWTVDGIIGGIK